MAINNSKELLINDMKSILLSFVSCIGLMNSIATSVEMSNNETLIASNYKVIEHGYFTFLIFINENEVKELVYSYYIDIDRKRVACSKSSETVYNIRDKKGYLKSLRLQTAKEFKRSQLNTWREKYYLCFAEDFLDRTNDEKIALLDKLNKK
jgi:hypothetical protein